MQLDWYAGGAMEDNQGSLWRNVVIFPTDLPLTGSEFHRVSASTEKL